MLVRLHILNFRCHADLELPELSQFNVLAGANGRGKTSVLEAVYMLSRCRSFRTHQTRELIHWGCEQFGVAGWFQNKDFQKLKIEWGENERNLAVDQSENLTIREFWGRSPCVVFQNNDRQIVQGGAQARRQWVDGLLSSMHTPYLSLVQKCQLLLKQKNALLRQQDPNRAIWTGLTRQLEQASSEIHRFREEFTEKAAPLLARYYCELTGRQESAEIRFEPAIPRHLALSPDALWQKERERGTACLGPHRDDWLLSLFDKPLRDYGSEGQVKSAALAFRLLEIQLIRETRGVWPILLIDDALTDLDPERRRRFWHLLSSEAQVLYATTTAKQDGIPAGAREIIF